MEPLRLLLIEDSENDEILLIHELKKGGFAPQHLRVDTKETLISALKSEPWDLVISDYNLPRFKGIEALKIVREHDPDLPFILVTGTVEEKTAVEAMTAGAQDCFIKGNYVRLLPALSRELQEARRKKEQAKTLRDREEQLRQAQKMEAVGQLAGGLAHDFNNILGVILLHSEQILESLEDSDFVKGGVLEILKAQERGTQLVRQLLAFGRRQISSPRVIDLNQLIHDSRKMLALALGVQNKLHLELSPTLPPIRVDPVQIDQVLMNLIVNARDAISGNGEVTLTTCLSKSAPEREIEVSVSDNGCGMDEKTKLKAFEPFFTTKPVGKGTGLGLSTVFGIIKQHGGEISVDSSPGIGTTFRIFLPVVSGDRLESPTATSVDRAPQRGHGKILLLDDEQLFRNLLTRALRQNGYEVVSASNGREALALGETVLKSFDLIVSDIVMPDLNGVDFVRQVRETIPDVQVLFISGNPAAELGHSGDGIAAESVLPKPFSTATFLEKVAAALRIKNPSKRKS